MSIYIARKVGLRTGKDRRKTKQEPWWKRRIKGSLEELRRHVNILKKKKNRRDQLRKKDKYSELARKYRIQEKGRRDNARQYYNYN